LLFCSFFLSRRSLDLRSVFLTFLKKRLTVTQQASLLFFVVFPDFSKTAVEVDKETKSLKCCC